MFIAKTTVIIINQLCCKKCNEENPSDSCTKPTETPKICANYKGQNIANYNGCLVHVRLQQFRLLYSQKNKFVISDQYQSCANYCYISSATLF